MAYTTINNGQLYFNTKLYTGTGSTLNITGVGFQPDLVWTKLRDSTAEGVMDHALVDSVRGVTKTLRSNTSAAEGTEANSLTAFGSDGYTVGNNGKFNYSSSDIYVSWNWLAGTAFTNDASATGIGTIDSTGSVNTTSGFSIVSWTGTGSNGTIKHGLSTAPKWVICKRIDADDGWWTYINSIGAGGEIILNSTSAQGSNGGVLWNSTNPTSSVFSVGTNGGVNASSGTYIAYCFADVQGYSKFGSYTGNGNADGPFVYTGFKPAFFIIKSSSDASTWHLADNKRIGYNPLNYRLQPNNSGEEYTGVEIYSDFLSNGFKLRNTDTDTNGSGRTYIYMAFAENPFTSSTGTPVTAR